MLSSQAISKYSKGQLASKWKAMSSRLANIRKETEETTDKVMVSGAQFGSFAVGRYAQQRMVLAGKRTTLDKAGKFDAFLLGGAAVALFGISPLSGKSGRHVAAAGTGLACVGATPFIDKLAAEHAAK